MEKLQQLFYAEVFGENYSNATSPQYAVDKYIADYAVDYRKETVADFENDLKEMGKDDFPYYRYLHTTSKSNKIVFYNDSLISFSIQSEDYMGGAHGTFYESNASVKISTLKKVQETDIFAEGYKEPLAQIIRAKLVVEMKEKSGGSEDDNEIKGYFNP